MSLVRWMCIFGVVAFAASCSGFDGGIDPAKTIPPPVPAEVVDATGDSEVVTQPVLSFVRPSAGASVDGDWIAVELALTGATLDASNAIALTTASATGTPLGTSMLTSLSGAVMTPAGAVTLRAELTTAGAPLSPPVFAEVSVTATRVTPGLAFVTPLAGARFDLETPIAYELALTDFTLLAAAGSQTGPRQGRVSLVVDAGEAVVSDAKTGSAPAQVAGEHTLTATLVDAAGVPWQPAVTATVAFAVDLPPLLTITTPAADSTVEGSRLSIGVTTERFVLDGVATPGHGTWLVRLDGTQVASRLTGTTAAVTGLAAGAHTLQVELRTYDDRALIPPVMTSVSFETLLLPPSLDIVLPTSSQVAEGAVRFAVLPHFFAFTNAVIPTPLVPATGGWELLIDDVVVASRLTTAQTEVVLTPGRKKVTARLTDNAGYPLVPPVSVTRNVDVVEVQTSVEILSPADGATVPKRFAVAVAFEDFKLTQTVLAPNDTPVPGQGHFHAFLRKEGTQTFVYQGFFLTETFELQADSPGRWDVLVALHYENHSPVLPPVEDVISVVVDDRPTIHIQTPVDGAVVGRDPFAVSVAIDNFQLIPIGEVSNTKGHYHLFIDTVYQDFYLEPFALIDPAGTQPAALTKGAHRLEAFLHRSNHTPVEGSVGQVIDFVYDPTPRVRMLTPSATDANGSAHVTTDPFEVTFELDNLTLVDKAGEPAVPGEGHVHVFIDDVYQGFETRLRFPLTVTAAGLHRLKLSLHENDHTAIAGAIPAFMDLFVEAAPRVRFLAPEDMGFVYGGDVDVMLTADNMGGGSESGQVELWLDDVLVYQGAPGIVTLPRLTEGEHTMFTVPLSEAGVPLANGEVKTVTFEALGLSPPAVSFVSPLPNATLGAGATVTIGTSGFTLEGNGAAQSLAVPGDGVWTLSVGDKVWGPFATPTISLPAMPRGPARLRADLWHRDGSRIVSEAFAEVPVQVGGTGPRLSLVAPIAGAMIYGADVEVQVEVADLELGPGKGWVSVKVDGRQQALFTRTHGIIGPFATGLHVLEVELLDSDRDALSPAVMSTSQFRIGGAAKPTVTITAPTDNAQVNGAVDVGFTVKDVVLDAVGLRGRAQAGRGAVLVYVDGRVKAIATASPAKLTGLSDGPHTIEVVVVGLDLVPIVPAATAQVKVR